MMTLKKIAIYKRYRSPQGFIDRAWASLGDNKDIALIQDTGATYPTIKQ
jgi:hypothetical protein